MPNKEIIMASTFGISPLKKDAKEEPFYASPLCLNLARAELSNQPLRNQSSFLDTAQLTALPTIATQRNVRGSIVCGTKGKASMKHRKGFSSITITARKIINPVNKSPKPANAAITDNECFLKINNRHSEILLSNNKDNLQLSATHPHSVLSCAHIKVLPQSSNSIYYYDKSLLVALDLPTNNNVAGLLQKSALSLKLSCTSSKVSADGGSGTLNLISLNTRPKRKVTFIVFEKSKVKAPSATLADNGFTKHQMSTVVDKKIPNCRVNLNGERKNTERECRQESTLSMVTKSATESPAVRGGEDKHSGLTSEHEKTPLRLLTLREALELHKPDFISRSQKRIEQLILKAEQRKVQLLEPAMEKTKHPGSPPDHTMSLSPTKKRQFTVPHPLSDNLFKPKERVIPEKEMQMRSKRIYNKLPEVKKKKEDEKKKAISQTNRLRAELFKKVRLPCKNILGNSHLSKIDFKASPLNYCFSPEITWSDTTEKHRLCAIIIARKHSPRLLD
uniref:ALMS motif domain-containing protein n=1 Tax=Callorhinchus milii TaxID=7868 RepID=A0A4W3HL34_CALMI